MIRPKEEKSLFHRLFDVAMLLFICFVVLGLAWTCSETGKILQPEERDCLADLRANTHRDTNYTEQEVVSYGRCIQFQRGL